MIKYLRLLYIYLIIFVIASCNSEDIDQVGFSNIGDTTLVVLKLNKEIFDTIDNNRKNNISEGDPFTIIESKRERDKLQITLTYGGGCKEHAFEIIWDGIVYTNDPCKMNLIIIHRGNNDNCEALITDTININLNELIGNIAYKDNCAYHIYSTYNFSENPDIIIDAIN